MCFVSEVYWLGANLGEPLYFTDIYGYRRETLAIVDYGGA
jgi:hypothetical protein